MKDIDFEELDKAVNSVMAGATAPSPTPAPTQEPSPEPVQSPAPEEAPAAPEATIEQTPAPAKPLAARRGGRFMDVVHPSSDMRTNEVKKPLPREGVTIAPTEPEPEPEPAPAAASSPVTPETPEILAEEPKVDIPEPTPTETTAAPEVELPSDDTAPLTSPFLPDAKVEKRPLGGNSGNAVSEALAAELSGTTPEITQPAEPAPQTQDQPTPETTPVTPEAAATQDKGPVSPPLPPELDTELVALESGETLPPKEETPQGPPTDPMGGSIPQQYKEQATTNTETHTPIYDQATQAQPLSHPAKKKSSWLLILWIILVAVAGVVGVALLYYLGIIA